MRNPVMARKILKTGDLVKILIDDWFGSVGIVSQPITHQNPGHVLVCIDGCILGVVASIEDVELVDEYCEGYAQLAYNLIRLGSHVIEQRLIVYRN